jgi:pimeloyl-ACP methyl ester carboxylesterase
VTTIIFNDIIAKFTGQKPGIKMQKIFLLICSLIIFVSCAGTSQRPLGYDAELSSYQYPFAVSFYQFKSQKQEMKMAYMDVRPEGIEKETIVLLHGKNFPAAYFEILIRALSREGYRVIAPDQVGFGKSTKPHNYQYSFQVLAENTHNLLASLALKKYILLGHSMGGMVATRFALMYPESLSKLFLVNPIGLEDWKTMTPYRNVDQIYQSELKTTAESIKKYQMENYYNNIWKAEYDKLNAGPIGWLKNPEYPLVAWNSALLYETIYTQPVCYEFKNIKVPTVLFIGQNDRTAPGKAGASEEIRKTMGNYPMLGRQTKKLIPGSKLVELPGLGHVPFIENFEVFWKEFKVFGLEN